jgi:hypoxanthine-DNA glycosylase
MRSHSFPPIETSDARVLILGSLPGPVSLGRGEYYAQPRNLFWRIMAAMTGCPATASYADRTGSLKARGIALWDVCESAIRVGALDTAIVTASVDPNDFATFLTRHRRIELICFNGTRAAALYARLVVPKLAREAQALRRTTLPSTSPAHASMPFNDKVLRWRGALAAGGISGGGSALSP